jgi:prepilin peptidase CpaA
MLATLNPWLPDALALGCALLAVLCDQRTRRIPNELTLATAVLALAWWTAVAASSDGTAKEGLGGALLGGATALACFAVLSWLGLLGFGDTKLVGAIGLCVGFPLALRVILCTVLCGGVLALGHAVLAGRLRAVAANMRRAGALAEQRIDGPGHGLHALPYAAAIALGTAWAIATRHLPELAPL